MIFTCFIYRCIFFVISFQSSFPGEHNHVKSIPQLIEIYKEIYQVPENFECILSVDAASLNRANKHSHSHVFVLYLQPLNPQFKCFSIHVYSKSNGKCEEDVLKIFDDAVSH